MKFLKGKNIPEDAFKWTINYNDAVFKSLYVFQILYFQVALELW